ncbi:MAG: ribonuclease HII [Alphaproteobacteria bacterium]|nr:ribonuclease HII [Alphaproteobacteria bacterium]
MQPSFLIENTYPNLLVASIDEAGRGPLAGPVVAACVILDKEDFPSGINDSKKLSKTTRKKIFLELKTKTKFGIGIVDEKIIDEINILEATKLAMLHAYLDLREKYLVKPQVILVDGNVVPFAKQDEINEILPVVKGDQKSLSIAAASILAKETRDQIMNELDKKYPLFGFAKHAGYPTKLHREMISKNGLCEVHRKSFSCK